jgi:hypothetical protein
MARYKILGNGRRSIGIIDADTGDIECKDADFMKLWDSVDGFSAGVEARFGSYENNALATKTTRVRWGDAGIGPFEDTIMQWGYMLQRI